MISIEITVKYRVDNKYCKSPAVPLFKRKTTLCMYPLEITQGTG